MPFPSLVFYLCRRTFPIHLAREILGFFCLFFPRRQETGGEQKQVLKNRHIFLSRLAIVLSKLEEENLWDLILWMRLFLAGV